MDTSNLDWSRTFRLNYPGGGYHARRHSVSDVKVKDIELKPISYISDYATSTFALRIEVAPGTLFSYRDTVYENGGPSVIETRDTTGAVTPRRLNSSDIGTLIYSLNEMKPIDFNSELNWYYYNGIETARIIEY